MAYVTWIDAAEELREYGQKLIGADLRAVTLYSADEHNPVYTREDIPKQLQLDEATRQMFRDPLVQLNKAV